MSDTLHHIMQWLPVDTAKQWQWKRQQQGSTHPGLRVSVDGLWQEVDSVSDMDEMGQMTMTNTPDNPSPAWAMLAELNNDDHDECTSNRDWLISGLSWVWIDDDCTCDDTQQRLWEVKKSTEAQNTRWSRQITNRLVGQQFKDGIVTTTGLHTVYNEGAFRLCHDR